jgi:hypothetical protein
MGNTTSCGECELRNIHDESQTPDEKRNIQDESQTDEKPNPNDESVSTDSKLATGAAVGIGAAAAAPTVLTAAINCLGFTPTGVAAGSLAAAWQGPAVAQGSWFALCQSIGAAGLSTAGTMVASGGTLVVVSGALYLYSRVRRCA